MRRAAKPGRTPSRPMPARQRRARLTERAALAALAACTLGTSAAAQDVDTSPTFTYPGSASAGFTPPSFGTSTLPSLGSGVRVGNLRPQLERLLPRTAQPRSLAPAVQFFPAIGVDVGFTDNASQGIGGSGSGRSGGADVFTLITPSLLVTADTARVQANLSYAPTVQLYASTPNANRFNQYLNAGALVSIVPETLFVNLRGSVTEQSFSGGFEQGTATPSGATTLDRDDRVTTASFLISPYLVRRFGGLGTAQLAYSLSYVDQGATDRSGSAPFTTTVIDPVTGLPVTTTAGRGVGNLLTHRQTATFTTGEDLGRIRSSLSLSATQYDGSGPYRDAHRNEAVLDNAYAITRTIAVLGAIGYQDLRYSTIPVREVKDVLWNVGIRFAPTPDDYISVRYGRKDGFNAFSADASYQTTPRTRVFLRYSTGLTTDLEESQNLLASTQVDSFGGSVDSSTGRPVGTSGNFFGTQNNLFELRRLSASGVLLLDRDSFTVSFVHESRTLVGAATAASAAAGGTAGTGIYTTLQWQRELSPALRSQLALQYGTRDDDTGGLVFVGPNNRSGATRTISATATLNYQLSETVSTRALYQISNRSGGGTNGDSVQNLVLVGLRKTF